MTLISFEETIVTNDGYGLKPFVILPRELSEKINKFQHRRLLVSLMEGQQSSDLCPQSRYYRLFVLEDLFSQSDIFANIFVIVMMTQQDYNSQSHPGHKKFMLTQRSKSQMITLLQPLPLPINSSESLASLKPWYFKPKKSLFRVEDDQIIKRKKKYNSLHWNQEENMKYAQFLSKFLALVQGEVPQKRKFHLNRMMSKHVSTRSAQQCRSHHQKMLKSFKTIEGIIEYFLGPRNNVQISTQVEIEEQKAEDKEAIKVDEIKMSLFLGNGQEEFQVESKQNYFLEHFNNRFNDFGYSGESFLEWGIHSFPLLDSQSL